MQKARSFPGCFVQARDTLAVFCLPKCDYFAVVHSKDTEQTSMSACIPSQFLCLYKCSGYKVGSSSVLYVVDSA